VVVIPRVLVPIDNEAVVLSGRVILVSREASEDNWVAVLAVVVCCDVVVVLGVVVVVNGEVVMVLGVVVLVSGDLVVVPGVVLVC